MKTSTIYGALMHHVTWDYLLSHILIFGTISLIRKCKEVQGSADKIKIRLFVRVDAGQHENNIMTTLKSFYSKWSLEDQKYVVDFKASK